jgi:hypothetical protein
VTRLALQPFDTHLDWFAPGFTRADGVRLKFG